MGHLTDKRGSGEGADGARPHHPKDANRVYGHLQDQDHVTRVLIDIFEDHLGLLFSRDGPVRDVISKAGTVTGHFVLQVTVAIKSFLNIHVTMICREKHTCPH